MSGTGCSLQYGHTDCVEKKLEFFRKLAASAHLFLSAGVTALSVPGRCGSAIWGPDVDGYMLVSKAQ